MIGACAYCGLTIATTDISGTGSVTLAIIDTEIGVASFFIAAPIVLVALYVYLHMYLLRLWQSLGSLPARFPDGRSLDEKAYPWLLTSLVQLYVPNLRRERQPLWWMQVAISIATAWLLVPATVVAFVVVVALSGRWVGALSLGIVAMLCAVVAGRRSRSPAAI